MFHLKNLYLIMSFNEYGENENFIQYFSNLLAKNKNLEKLSCLYIEQCLSSDCFIVNTPNHFQHQLSKKEDIKKAIGNGKSPNKYEEEKNRSFSGRALAGLNPMSPDFSQSRPLRTISEEAYLSQSHDHQKLVLRKLGQRNVSEDVDLDRSDSDKKN